MRSGTVPPSIKMALVTSSLRKPTLDPNTLKNYKPLSNLPYVSKILERIVFRRLLDYLNITHQPSSLGQSHASATTGAWPYRIEYYICLCGHLGGVSEVQTSLDVSDLFEGHKELTLNWPRLSCTVTCFCCYINELIYRKVGDLLFWIARCTGLRHGVSNHIVAAIMGLGTQWHQREIPSLSISVIPTEISKLCSQAAVTFKLSCYIK